MLTIKRTTETELAITPVETAEIIWSMNDDEQVEMLNHLAKIAGHLNCFQLQCVTDNEALTTEARMLMAQIGNYSEKAQC